MSFIHYIEKKMEVKYRFNKIFVSTFIRNNKKHKMKLEYFVGKKNIDYRIKNHNIEQAFKNLKQFLSYDFGKFNCWIINTKDCLKAITRKIKKKNNFLIK